MMVILYRTTNSLLSKLIQKYKYSQIDGLVLPVGEEIAPRFLLELVSDRLKEDPENSFWWFPRLIVVDRSIVGMISFKNPPDSNGLVEIGYGIVAYTSVSNLASQKVLEKNQFVREGSKFDPEDGKVLIWRKMR